MDDILDMGSKLVVARRAQGMSQRELGERLGVRQQQVARWEAVCYRTATLERVDATAKALGMEAIPTAGPDLAAEAPTTYVVHGDTGVVPVRDLGEIAARIRAHCDELRDLYTITRVGVFGSFAHGEQTLHSDVDLLVECREPGGFRLIEAARRAEEILGRNVDFVRTDLLKESLRDRVLKDVVYVWSA